MAVANGTGSSPRVVLRHLLDSVEPRTRPEIADTCELSRPTVLAAVERLERVGLLECIGQRSGLPGRSASLFAVPRAAGCVAAVDIGGSNLRIAVSDLLGRPMAETRRRTQARGGGAVVRQTVDLLRRTIADLPQPVPPLLAVAVSVPGAVDEQHSVVRYAWNVGQSRPYDFRSRLVEGLGVPVFLDNNVNFAALGEQWQGIARDLSTFAVVAVGAGVGVGIVHNGELIRGTHGAAGEVAFLPFDRGYPRAAPPSDEPGAATLLREAQATAGWHGRLPASVEELFTRAATGEEPAATLVETECRRIGAIITTICAIVDPDTIVLTGGVGANPALVHRAAEIAQELAPFPPAVVPSALGERASLVGALAVALRQAREAILDRVDERPRPSVSAGYAPAPSGAAPAT